MSSLLSFLHTKNVPFSCCYGYTSLGPSVVSMQRGFVCVCCVWDQRSVGSMSLAGLMLFESLYAFLSKWVGNVEKCLTWRQVLAFEFMATAGPVGTNALFTLYHDLASMALAECGLVWTMSDWANRLVCAEFSWATSQAKTKFMSVGTEFLETCNRKRFENSSAKLFVHETFINKGRTPQHHSWCS